jgi:hypothetical protein
VSELGRRRAFIWAIAMVAGAAALLVAIDPMHGRERRKPVPDSPAFASGLVAAKPLAGRETNAPDHGSLTQARETARLFARTFLRYQRGAPNSRTRTLLARTASARVRRYLISAPPRLTGDAARASVRSLRLYGPRRGRVKASALLAYRGRRSLFEFLLERGEDGWRVTELHP